MKIKTIEKIIKGKMNHWLESLPESLQLAVRNALLVSGGSITSLLLNEQVNDYDIYIQDKEVLLRLADHYAGFYGTMPKFRVLQGRYKQQYLEENLSNRGLSFDSFTISEHMESDTSEHFLRYKTLKENQIKLDIPSTGVKVDKKFFPKIEENEVPQYYVPVFYSQNAISISNSIQIVLRFHGTCEQIHKTFDFIHATNYFTFKEGLVLNIDALKSVIGKELIYQGSYYPVTSIIRTKKFIKRGWTISAAVMLKIIFQCSLLDLTDPEILEEQLIGVDVAYFATLIAILKGEPGKIGYTRLIEALTEALNSMEIDNIDNNTTI